ncbi:hypothetical protein OHB07_16200 [Streptomyces sp. NBC_00111]|uniref:hypothetical protein n=1 Tax=Streptomyces sp. NBC_00111 TaxID=2975655 RepID=UPI00324BBF4C
MERSAHITLNSPTSVILVNGRDISHCVRGLTFTADVGSKPALDLDLVLDEVTVDGQALVSVPSHTADVLTSLGWTPPASYDTAGPRDLVDAYTDPALIGQGDT